MSDEQVLGALERAFGPATPSVVRYLTHMICDAVMEGKRLPDRIKEVVADNKGTSDVSPIVKPVTLTNQPAETKAEMVDRLRQKIVGNLSLRDFFYNYLLSQDNEDEVSKRLSDYGNYRDKLSKIDSEMNRSSFWSRIAILSSQIAMGQKTFAIAEQEYRGATVQRDIPTPQVATDSSDDAVVGLLKGLNDNGGDS